MTDDPLLKSHETFYENFIRKTCYFTILAAVMFGIVFLLTT